MVLTLLSLIMSIASAQEPALTIVVTDSIYEEIYFEDPRVICSSPCMFEQDSSIIFVEANRNHKAWYKHGKVSGIYNNETIKYAYEECNFKLDPHGCAKENSLWVMRTTISIDSNRASINIMIFDETAAMIGQGTYTRFKKTRLIERKKVTQSPSPSQPISTSNCNQSNGNCATVRTQIPGKNTSLVEDLEPTVIEIPPIISPRDIGQAMIMAYDSIRQ